MKKYLLVLVSLCCALLPALAEHPEYPELKKSDANIIGHVLDKKTSEHLPYITIALKGTTIGTVTDATGHYFLKNLPEGTYTQNAQKLYTDDRVEIGTNQIIEDTFDGQRYTVKTSLGHNSIHPMMQYIVEGVVKK